MSTTFSCPECKHPARYTPDDELVHEDLDAALDCRYEGLTPEEVAVGEPAGEVECTCGLTFPDQAGFDGHQDQEIQERGTLSGHWEVGTI